jgi:trehalose 6-phosphate phosphatase
MDLLSHIDQIAQTRVLLVASDYDGTLAPIVSEPSLASPHPEAIAALKTLAEAVDTHVAIISGRSLADLAAHVAGTKPALWVGSHGAEFSTGFTTPLPAALLQLHEQLVLIARSLAAQTPGTLVEVKPAGAAFHYRNAPPAVAAVAVEALLQALKRYPEVHIQHGKMVIEYSLVQAHKGTALSTLRQHLGATAVCFIGDDVTDENAFAALSENDLGIKVGEGPSLAQYRIPDTLAAAAFLTTLARRRVAQ